MNTDSKSNPYAAPETASPTMTQVPAEVGSVAFWSFLLTQFLGAFNDNYFKQMVLLTSIGQAAASSPDRQPLALAAFALPFVLLSGLGGFLSDRLSKRRVIVGCKLAEVVITTIGLGVLLVPGLSTDVRLLCLIGVLSLMGAHSAIFGPSKYGILPELFRSRQLRPVNGAVQMTTFLAIIFGTACAGFALDTIGGRLWIGSAVAIGIAMLGTASSVFIPRTPVAEPGIRISWQNATVPMSVVRMIGRTRGLLAAILVASLFWFLGGITQIAVNTLGKRTLELSETRTSLLVCGIGFGIAVGCLVAGFLGRGQQGRQWVITGAWMLCASLLLVALLGSGLCGSPASSRVIDSSLWSSLVQADRLEWALRFSMVLIGLAAGMFVVPIQVFLQQAPPAEFKGRLLGVQNLATWIGILLAAAYAWLFGMLLQVIGGENADARLQWAMFVSLALLLLPVALWYRLPDAAPAQSLSESPG
jgi:acyl-[acyl-carrier-protein]-phospholipid O-acyltransferase/long-chain-fatty-acid--[acyl-carrier-protein] ligase